MELFLLRFFEGIGLGLLWRLGIDFDNVPGGGDAVSDFGAWLDGDIAALLFGFVPNRGI